jgi:small subunit ribosomal protein S6
MQMAKLSEKYELVVIFNTKQGEEKIKEEIAKFKSLIEENGTLITLDEWGKRKLAYEINDELDGYYVLFNFESKPDFPVEIERRLNIAEGVLRFLVTVLSAK